MHRILFSGLILSLLVILAGCSSLSETLANRIACTADGKQVLQVSMYGPIGIGSKTYQPDAAAILAAGCGKAR